MKKILLFAFPMLFASLMAQAQVYYTQDFEAGMPMGWTSTGSWELTNSAGIASQYFAPAAHTMFMGFNDDGLGNSFTDKGRVTSGPIDLTTTTGKVVLTFESYFVNGDYNGADETAKISVSTDAGATWTEVYDLQISGAWQEIGTVLNYPGQTIWLAFDYDDGGEWNYGWCFDDVKIQEPSVFRDMSFLNLNGETLVANGLVGGEVWPGCTVKNNGVETITSVDLTWTAGSNTVTETLSGLNITFGNSAILQSSTPYIIEEGTNEIAVSISNVNGLGADEDAANDAGNSFTVTSTTVHPDKGVIVEEATGTWCQWCPRGAVFLDVMTHRYPGHFVGVAVHNQDPMVLAAYNSGVTSFPGFSGFPSVVFNRTSILDPEEIEAPFQTSADIAPPARLKVGAEYNDATRELTVNVGAQFLEDIGAGYKLNAVLIEDGVTGTTAAYNQANAYSGGNFGEMGGYEVLPGSVPASQMVYNHVGRALLGGFAGAANSLPAAATTGQTFGHTFTTYTIPAGYNLDNIHLVGVMTNASGQAVNAIATSLAEAIANGPFVSGTNDVVNNDAISVSPNPFSSVTNVTLNLTTAKDVTMQVYDAVGKLVAERSYGEMVGEQTLPFNGANLTNGMYFIHVRMGDTLATKRVYLSK
jgi:Outer membrane protein Omp28/Secretion system C-terminal sorting domain